MDNDKESELHLLNQKIAALKTELTSTQARADQIDRWENGFSCEVCQREFSLLWSPAYLRSMMGPGSMVQHDRYVEAPGWCIECWSKRTNKPETDSKWFGRIRYCEAS